ncbi:MAG: site-2 protease family protein [Mesorhizobium sp.]|nr:site-2 protease family protein [Mesorhizobium sp.]
MPDWTATLVIGFNLALIFLLIAAPIGTRTIARRTFVRAPAARVWNAVWPLGGDAGWSGEILSAAPAEDGGGLTRIVLSWLGRDGNPIERLVRLDDVRDMRHYEMRVVDDSSLHADFWAKFHEEVTLEEADGGVHLTMRQTDSYRGLAFYIFRYFVLRRQMAKLRSWSETGAFRKGGVFEHPLTQVGMAIASILILWPLAGLTPGGLAFAVVLTIVVALHELGHMAAFRVAGHRSARMIFIPLLGGIAIGGRPYDSHFEVAFVALMGAGFSAFLVPPLMAASQAVAAGGNVHGGNFLAVAVACIALFNLANLVPVWKFDGGQVLRQICPNTTVLAIASFALLAGFLAVGASAGFPTRVLVVGGAVFAILSLITTGSGVRPRDQLKPLTTPGRLALAGALAAVIVIHSVGVLWSFNALV